MRYQAYPTKKDTKRRTRKHQRNVVFRENKALHSSRVKEEGKKQ